MRFTTADFLPTFWTLVYEIYHCGLFAYFLDPSSYIVTPYEIVTRGEIDRK